MNEDYLKEISETVDLIAYMLAEKLGCTDELHYYSSRSKQMIPHEKKKVNNASLVRRTGNNRAN